MHPSKHSAPLLTAAQMKRLIDAELRMALELMTPPRSAAICTISLRCISQNPENAWAVECVLQAAAPSAERHDP